MENLRVCIVSSEAVPFAKTGGLGDVVGALGKFLKGRGVDVRTFLPCYDILDTDGQELVPVKFLQNLHLRFGYFTVPFRVFSSKFPGSNAEIYFIDCPELFHRGTIYTGEEEESFRFAFFCQAVIETCQRMGWGPHVFHCNDWHTALIPLLLKTTYNWDRLFQFSKTILTIHNIAYQGTFSRNVLNSIGLSDYLDKLK